MKTVRDLQKVILAAPESKVRACLISIARVWLTNPREEIKMDSPLNPETPLDSDSLTVVTRLLNEYGFWPNKGE